jgi:hypothetical protein
MGTEGGSNINGALEALNQIASSPPTTMSMSDGAYRFSKHDRKIVMPIRQASGKLTIHNKEIPEKQMTQ